MGVPRSPYSHACLREVIVVAAAAGVAAAASRGCDDDFDFCLVYFRGNPTKKFDL